MCLLRRGVVIALLFVASSRCGSPIAPSDIATDWEGRVAPTHFDFLMLRFSNQQTGRLQATACLLSDAIHVVWRDVPVHIDYPNLAVHYGGFTFEGGFASDGSIVGNSSYGQAPYPMSLSPGGNYCGSGDREH